MNKRSEMQNRWKLKAMENVPDHVHGTWNGYANYTCRCEFCMEAYEIYKLQRKLLKRVKAVYG